MSDSALASSFRDPSGFLFRHEGVLLRQVNQVYAADYDLLMSSGLYDRLVEKHLLIPHVERDTDLASDERAYRVLCPDEVPFISYPYEWSFSQLKDAALTTLRIQKLAMRSGMTLKDASAYNIQFVANTPLLIDTLSFTKLEPGSPWVAYRQFCKHFLAPLALMAYQDIQLGKLLRQNIDGLSLPVTSKLLPWRTRLVPSLLMHIHAHAASQKKFEASEGKAKHRPLSANALLGIIDSLAGAVRRLQWQPSGTEWAEYYSDTNYTSTSQEQKAKLVEEFLTLATPQTVWDLGANNGLFSRLASEQGIHTVASDIDPAAVEINYLECRKRGDDHLLPLLIDLTNPSPGLGWEHRERMSLLERGPADTVLALALIHHLAISNNVPFDRLAEFFARAGRTLIIEFVPKSDSQVQRLLSTREDVFPEYRQDVFEDVFGRYFQIRERKNITGSERALYLMQAITGAN